MEEHFALAMALQNQTALEDVELRLNDDQRSSIRKEAWSAELKIENKDLREEINISKKTKSL